MRPGWEPIPIPDKRLPPLINHPFEPYQLGSLTICIHLDGIHPCARPEDEHAPGDDQDGLAMEDSGES